MNDILKAAHEYASMGWHIFPVVGKRPALDRVKRWSVESTTDPEVIERWFADSEGHGIGLDLAKSKLVAVDGDNLDRVPAELLELLEASDAWLHRGNPERKTFLFSENGHRIPQAVHGWGEVKAAGGYIVLAPSPHNVGGQYVWLERPETGAPPVMPEGIEKLIAPIVKDAPEGIEWDGEPASEEEVRQAEQTFRRLIGNLASTVENRNILLNTTALILGHYVPHILDEKTVRDALEDACDKNGLVFDDGLPSVRDTIDSGLRKGKAEPQRPEVIGIDEDEILADVEPPPVIEWQDPQPFIVGSTVPYPVDALPPAMAAAVEEVADAVIVDPAVPAMAFLGAAAGAFGAQTEVALTPTWKVRCNLYLVTVADTATGKTPGSTPAWSPLIQLEDAIKAEAKAARQKASVVLPVHREALKQKQKNDPADVMTMMTLQGEIDQAEADMNRDARLLVDDVTPERLAELLHDNHGRIVAVNDEGSLLRHLLGMYSNNPNLDPFLKGWDGNRLTVDRKGSGDKKGTEIVVPEPRITLIAAVQPITIREIGQPKHRGLIERGVLGRILPSWPQDTVGQRLFASKEHKPFRAVDPWNATVIAEARRGQVTLAFTEDASQRFFQWHDAVERELPGVYSDIRSFSKIRDSVARVAGILARLDGAIAVEVDHVERAIRIGDYHLAHAQAIVEAWASAPTEVARGLLAKIVRRLATREMDNGQRFENGAMRFTVREAAWVLGGKVKTDVVIDALHLLEEHGYVQPESGAGYGASGAKVGKMSPVVLLHPAQARG